jgi:hypothetical protein
MSLLRVSDERSEKSLKWSLAMPIREILHFVHYTECQILVIEMVDEIT